MAEIDNLSVSIIADANSASRSIDKLIQKVSGLSSTMRTLNTSGLTQFSQGIQQLTTSMQGMKSVNASVFTKTVKGLKKFETVDSGKLSSLATSLQPLATSISQLSTAQFDSANMSKFINSLSGLASSNINSLNGMNFTELGRNISNLSTSLANAPTVSKNTISLTTAVARLGATGGTIGAVTTALPSFSKNLRNFIKEMSKVGTVERSVIEFTSALGMLASAGARTKTTAENLDKLAIKLKEFMATMQNAPQVSQNTLQLVTALGNLRGTSVRLNAGFGSMSKGMSGLSGGIPRLHKGFKGLAYTFGKFYANCWLLIRGFSLINKAIETASDLTEVQNVVDVSFGQYSKVMEDFTKTSMEQFGMTELTGKTIGSRFQAMANAMGLVNAQAKGANSWLSKQNVKYEDLGNSVADMSVNLTKLAADMGSFYNVEGADVAEDLQAVFTGMTRPLRKYGLDLTEATLKEWALKNGMDANLKSMSQAQKTMLRYQYVMANTSNAQLDYSRTADTWANRIRLLKQQFQQFGIVIGQTFIYALKPALRAMNSFMTAVIKFATTVSNALGKIFGWEYEAGAGSLAEDYDDAGAAAEDLADNTGKAADNAKKLKHQLQGFDELNNLTSNDGDNGGGGKGSGGGAGAGVKAASDIAGEWKKTTSVFESSYDTLYKLGEYIGTTFKKNLDSIDWERAYQGASNFGSGLAQLLNGFNASEVFGSLGTTLAGGLNTALHALNSFAKDYDWTLFGKSLSDGVNNFFKTFDSTLFAQTVNNWVKGALTTATTFFKKTDFEQIGNKIGEFLSGLDLTEWMGKFADMLWAAIKDGFDLLKGLIEESPLETALIATFSTFKLLGVGGIISSAIGKAIKAKLAEKLGVELAGEMGIKDIISSKLAELISGINLGMVGTVAAEVGIAIAVAVAFFKLGKYLYKNVPTVQQCSDALVELVGGLFTGDYKISEVVNAAVEMGVDVLTNFANLFLPDGSKIDSSQFKQIPKLIVGLITGDQNAQAQVIDFFVNLSGKIDEKAKEVKAWFTDKAIPSTKEYVADVKTKIGDRFDEIKNYFADKKDEIKNLTANAIANGKDKLDGFISSWNSIIDGVTKNVNVNATIDNIKSKLSDSFNDAKDWIKDKSIKVSSTVSSVKENLDASIENAKAWLKKQAALSVKVTIGLTGKIKSAWRSAKAWWDKNVKLKIPDLGFHVSYSTPSGKIQKAVVKALSLQGWPKIAFYANGGFPEDGWFRASQGEIMGSFDNGKSVVANNMQITKGISAAVYEGNRDMIRVMQAELTETRKQNEILQGILEKETGISSRDLFNSVRKSSVEYRNRTGNPAFA